MKLYIVPTPIGNLKDITERAKEVLASVSYILCEDTRSTLKLLNALGIKNKLVACHKFNELETAEKIFKENKEESIALVSDAGTPCISDPGSLIVKKAIEEGCEVIPLAGASAVTTAFSASGFSGRFLFLGFLDRKKLKQEFETILKGECENYIFYESPKRILETLKKAGTLGKVKVAVFNDLTKLYERAYRGSLGDVIKQLEENENRELGEYTVVLNIERNESENKENNKLCLEAVIVNEMVSKNITKKEAIKCLSEKYNHRDLYAAGERLKTI